MQPSDLSMFAVCMHNTPLRFESETNLQIIVANACNLTDTEKTSCLSDGQLLDDSGDNISCLNPWWGELTAVYWLLKNDTSPLVGNCQYRRHWNEDAIAAADSSVLYTSEPCTFGLSLAQQFRGGHSFPGVEMTMDLAVKGKLPFSASEMAGIWHQHQFQGGPMLFGPRASYERVMNVLFDCLWPVWEEYQEQIKGLSGYDQRAMAFLSERFLSGIVLYKEKFLGNMPISRAHLGFVD
jgi:hypothetical protein